MHSEDRVCVGFSVSVVQGRVSELFIPESPIIPCGGEKVVSLDVEFDRCVLEGEQGNMEWDYGVILVPGLAVSAASEYRRVPAASSAASGSAEITSPLPVRRDDPDDIGDVFEPLPPLENVDLDSELDMCVGLGLSIAFLGVIRVGTVASG